MAAVEEEETTATAKEVQALDKGTGGIICIESLLDPFLLKPPLVVKLDVIQEVPEDSSGTHSTRTAISQLAGKQRICVKGKGKRNKRTNEQGVVQNVKVVVEDDVLVQDMEVPPVDNVEDNLLVQDGLYVPPISNLPKLNSWKLNRHLSPKTNKFANAEKKRQS